MAGERLRVLMADDHPVFRSGLRTTIAAMPGVEVVGEAATGDEAAAQAASLTPDVVLMDIQMPGMNGIEATRRLAGTAPHVRVLALTISFDESDVTEAVLAGACGYLLKDSSIDEIVNGVRAAARGESLVSPRVAAGLLDRVREAAGGREDAETRPDLTDREIEVLRLMAEGRDNNEIASALFISTQTVKNHVSNILRKLETETRVEAAVYAVKNGLA